MRRRFGKNLAPVSRIDVNFGGRFFHGRTHEKVSSTHACSSRAEVSCLGLKQKLAPDTNFREQHNIWWTCPSSEDARKHLKDIGPKFLFEADVLNMHFSNCPLKSWEKNVPPKPALSMDNKLGGNVQITRHTKKISPTVFLLNQKFLSQQDTQKSFTYLKSVTLNCKVFCFY